MSTDPAARPLALRLETLAVHAGADPDAATGAVTQPIHLSTTFERDPDGGYGRGFSYSREGNPNRVALERALAALEGGDGAVAFSSGSAATSAMLQVLAPGDHVVAPTSIYYGTQKLMRELFGPWGLETTFVDMRDLDAVAAAMRPRTRLVWAETPSNPLLAVVDIARLAEIAHAGGAVLAVDNTWASPVGQRPLALGADVVMHATTKYLGGHSDVLGGALVFGRADELLERVRTVQTSAGAVPSPFECWLVLRGLKTLPVRMRAHTANATRVAEFLASHAAVEVVHYPGLSSHPDRDVVARQMLLAGGMASFQVRGGAEDALRVASRVRVFTRATSLGGSESLIEHRASVEGPSSTTPQNLLRISVGLEHHDDLLDDLAHALET